VKTIHIDDKWKEEARTVGREVQMEPVLESLYYRISVKKITQPIASLNTAKQQLINTKSSIMKPTSPTYYT
jgi:hypothetical protein